MLTTRRVRGGKVPLYNTVRSAHPDAAKIDVERKYWIDKYQTVEPEPSLKKIGICFVAIPISDTNPEAKSSDREQLQAAILVIEHDKPRSDPDLLDLPEALASKGYVLHLWVRRPLETKILPTDKQGYVKWILAMVIALLGAGASAGGVYRFIVDVRERGARQASEGIGKTPAKLLESSNLPVPLPRINPPVGYSPNVVVPPRFQSPATHNRAPAENTKTQAALTVPVASAPLLVPGKAKRVADQPQMNSLTMTETIQNRFRLGVAADPAITQRFGPVKLQLKDLDTEEKGIGVWYCKMTANVSTNAGEPVVFDEFFEDTTSGSRKSVCEQVLDKVVTRLSDGARD